MNASESSSSGIQPPAQRDLSTWVRRITDEQMPIFGRTVQEVVSIAEDDVSSAAQLGQVVLKDASMTSRVLKLANSTHYNPTRQKFSTISRAIMMLGFDAVRNMCLTVSLIDSLVEGTNRKHLVREVARCLHAATQAKMIAEERGDKHVEEIYITTLLLHVGDLAFWCFCGKEGEALDAAMQLPHHTPESAQKEVLGFSLRKLSLGLAKEWGLSGMLQETLQDQQAKDPTKQTIFQAHKLAAAAEKGWDSPAVKEITETLAEMTEMSSTRMKHKLHHCAKQAAENSAFYGAKFIADVIPLPPQLNAELDGLEHPEPEANPAHPEPDSRLQLQILRELTSISGRDVNINVVIEMILEGIHRGVGMDRAMFALLTPDRRMMRSKFVLGDEEDELRSRFQFQVNSAEAQLPIYCMKKNASLWVGPNSPPSLKMHLTPELKRMLGTNAFFIAPIVVQGKPIGVFYADRGPSKRELDEESFDSFKHFTSQAGLVLNHLAGQR